MNLLHSNVRRRTSQIVSYAQFLNQYNCVVFKTLSIGELNEIGIRSYDDYLLM